MITKEKRFDAIIKDGEITFLLSAREMPPHNSQIGINKNCAMLFRDEHEDVLLTGFNKEIIKLLDKIDKINILEISSSGKIIFDYLVETFKDPTININE